MQAMTRHSEERHKLKPHNDRKRGLDVKKEKSVFQIDRQNLDEELATQPSNFHKAAVRFARATAAALAAKAAFKVAEAEVSLDIRRNPAKYKLDKVTDKAIEFMTVLHLSYREAIKALNDAQHEEEVAKAAVDALTQKGHSLRGLVYLTGAEYTQPNEDFRGKSVNRRNRG